MIYRFTLTYNGVDTEVCEPRDFANFQSEIKRDFNSHGVVFKYTSETLKLGFADGRDVLEGAFQLEGFDAEVQLAIDRREDEYKPWSNVFTGNARMESRELDDMYFNCDFETSIFQQRVINRLDTKVKLGTTIDLDGNTLTGSLSSNVSSWKTIRLNSIYEANFSDDPDVNISATFPYANPATVQQSETDSFYFGYGAPTVKSLDVININGGSLNVQDGYLGSEGGASGINVTPLWTTSKSGLCTFSGNLIFKVSNEFTKTVATDLDVSYTVQIYAAEGHGGVYRNLFTLDSDTVNYPFSDGTGTWTEDFGIKSISFNETFNVVAGDSIYFVINPRISHTVFGAAAQEPTVTLYATDSGDVNSININLLQDSLDVGVKSWFVHDVFERLCYILTGDSGGFYSDFFGNTENGYLTDGCGALNILTNGAQLRGIDNELNTSLSDLLDWASARYGTGWGFEKQYDGSYRIRVEPMEHFYQDNEIMDLGNPVSIKELDSYKETGFDDLLNNKVEIGYSKFSTEIGINNDYEDFLTKAEYSLPISSLKGSYRKISPYIASNDLIQATFDRRDNFTKSWKYDEDIFIIAAQRNEYGVVPENAENFESTTGLDDVDTAYNIRHAPVYMFLDHALIVNSTLMGKTLDKLIQNVSIKINDNFSAKFAASEDCLLGDIQRLLRSSSGNIEIGDNFAGLRLFDPIQHEFTVAMSNDQFNTLVDAMEGDSPGYLTYRDDDGNVQTGYLLTATWSPVEGVAQIKTVERADNYVL